MKILCDLHHEGLYESLRLLFEVRLGWELYRPIGLDWYHEGFWLVHPHIDTANQYLAIGGAEPLDAHGRPVTQSHGESAWINRTAQDAGSGVYRAGKYKAITLAAAKEVKWDAIMSSMPVHFPMFERFRQEFCPKAPHIFQQGNMWAVPAGVKNHLNSTKVRPPEGTNHVYYHPEFDLREFSPSLSENPRSVINLCHCHQKNYQEEFFQLERLMKPLGWTFKDHGASNRDGPVPDVAAALRQTGFLWHCKAGGEGYGFNLHNAAAMGRPILTHRSLYNGMTAEDQLVPGESVVDMDGRSLESVAANLELIAKSDQYPRMYVLTVGNFRSVVNFDKEEQEIRRFLERLQ